MSKSKKIQSVYGSCLMGIDKHKAGYWGNHGSNDDSWLGYLIVIGILVVSFLMLLLIG